MAVQFTSTDGGTVFQTRATEWKPDCGQPGAAYPDCLYATDFPMFAVAPAYRAVPADGSPADAVTNLGLGTILEPWRSSHTNYLFVWQWSQAAAASAPPPLGPSLPPGQLEPWP